MMSTEPGLEPAHRQEGPVLEAFAYPECPWTEELAGFSLRLADVFPGAATSPVEPASAQSSAGGVDGTIPAPGAVPESQGGTAISARNELELERWLQEERSQAEEHGRSLGLAMGIAQGRREMAAALEAEREQRLNQVAAAISSFAEERDAYLHRLEEEAVHLALAIAARVLRREAQMDPLLLTGAVRVALGQLAESTKVRLHVPMRDRALWSEALARLPGLPLKPEILGEEGLEAGQCRMETELGSLDLGVRAQLKEIERGFFDRIREPRREVVSAAAARWPDRWPDPSMPPATPQSAPQSTPPTTLPVVEEEEYQECSQSHPS